MTFGKTNFSLYLGGTLMILHVLFTLPTGTAADKLQETLIEDDAWIIGVDVIDHDNKYQRNKKGGAKFENTVQILNTEPECPPPYFRLMSECFYVHVHHHLPWEVARSFCKDMGGDLAEPSYYGALLAVVSDKYSDGPQHFWLGASDLEEEGHFQWLSGGNVQSGWRTGQPDDDGGIEDCLELWPAKYPSFGDKNCNHSCAFICQYKHQ